MALEKFHYQIGDVDVALPRMGNLPLGIIRRFRKTDDSEKVFVIFETLFAEGSPELDALDTLDAPGLTALMEAWQADAEITVGESSAS